MERKWLRMFLPLIRECGSFMLRGERKAAFVCPLSSLSRHVGHKMIRAAQPQQGGDCFRTFPTQNKVILEAAIAFTCAALLLLCSGSRMNRDNWWHVHTSYNKQEFLRFVRSHFFEWCYFFMDIEEKRTFAILQLQFKEICDPVCEIQVFFVIYCFLHKIIM